MLGLIACICILLIGIQAWQLWRVHDANIEQAIVVTATTARSMAEQADTALKTADTIVASFVERMEAEGTVPEARTRFYRLMTSLAAALPAIHEMVIADEQGNAIVKSLTPDPMVGVVRKSLRPCLPSSQAPSIVGQQRAVT